MATDVIGSAFIDIKARVTGFESQVATKTRTAMGAATREVRAGSAAVAAESAKMETGVVSRMERMGSSVTSSLGKTFGAAKAQIAGFLPSMGLLIPAAAGVAGASMVKAAGNFQQAMEQVHTQAGAAQSEVESMKRAVLGMAGRVSQTPVALANGLYHIESAGFRGTKALSMLTAAAKGATVGNADLESVTQAMIASMASGIKGVAGASDAMALLNRTVGIGDMRMEGLAQAMSTGILPSARSAGLGLNDVSAALATITDNATPPQEAATRLRMTFSMLSAPTAAASLALESIGLKATQLGTDMRKPDGLLIAIDDLKSHLESAGLTAVQQNAVIARAFGGGRTSGAILTLLEESGRLSDKYKELGDSASRAKMAEDAWHHTQSNFNVQMHSFEANVSAAGIAIGTVMLPYMSKFVGWLSDGAKIVANNFTPALHSISGVISSVFGTAQTVKPTINVEPKAHVRTGALNDALKRSGLHGHALNDLRDSLTPKFTVTTGQAQAAHVARATHGMTGANLKNATAGMMDDFTRGAGGAAAKPAGVSLGRQIVTGITDALHGKGTTALGHALGAVLKDAMKGAFDLGAMIGGAIRHINWLNLGKTIGQNALPLILGIVNTLLDPMTWINLIMKHPLDIATLVLSVGFLPEKIVGIIGETLAKVPFAGKLLKWAFDAIHSLGSKVIDGFLGVGRNVLQGLERGLFRGASPITKFFVKMITELPTYEVKILLKIGNMGARVLETIGRFFGRIPGVIGEVFGRVIRAVIDFGARMLDRIGVNSANIGRLWNGIKDIFMGPIHWLESNIMAPIVRFFGGIIDFVGTKIKAIGNLWGGIKSIFMTPVKWVVDHVFNGGIAKAWNAVAGHLHLPEIPTIKLARGGPVPDVGRGNGDSVPAMLMPGEYVLSKRAVDRLGIGNVHALHETAKGGGEPRRFGIGGFVHSAWSHTGGALGHLAGGAFNFAKSIAERGITWTFDHLLDPVKHLVDTWAHGDGEIQHGIGRLADDMITSLENLVHHKDPGTGTYGGVSGNVSSWSNAVLEALRLTGRPPSWLAGVLQIISHESGGNPRAINLTDSNAQAGDPSRGLMQTIGSTFESYRLKSLPDDIYNPLANIAAGIKYIISRYGDISNVPGLANMARGGSYVGYAHGGVLPAGKIIGKHLASGKTIMLNEREQELVLPLSVLRRMFRGAIPGVTGTMLGNAAINPLDPGDPTSILLAQRTAARAEARVHDPRVAKRHAAHDESVALRRVNHIKAEIDALHHRSSAINGSKKADEAAKKAIQANIDALEKHEKAAQRVEQRVKSHLDKTISHYNAAVSAAKQAQQALRQAVQSFVQNITDSFRTGVMGGMDVGSLFNYQPGYGPASITSVLAQLRQRIADTRTFGKMLIQLARKGLDRETLIQLLGLGPQAGIAIARELLSDPNAIASLSELERTLREVSSQIAAQVADATTTVAAPPTRTTKKPTGGGSGLVHGPGWVRNAAAHATAHHHHKAHHPAVHGPGWVKAAADHAAAHHTTAHHAATGAHHAATAVHHATKHAAHHAAAKVHKAAHHAAQHAAAHHKKMPHVATTTHIGSPSTSVGTHGPAPSHYTEVGPAIVVHGDLVIASEKDLNRLSRELYRHEAAVKRATGTSR